MAARATLYLEDGTSFSGKLFGASVSVPGEVGKSKLCIGLVYVVVNKISVIVSNCCCVVPVTCVSVTNVLNTNKTLFKQIAMFNGRPPIVGYIFTLFKLCVVVKLV